LVGSNGELNLLSSTIGKHQRYFAYETNNNGKPFRILRLSMKTLTQIWIAFLLSNVIPKKHSSDLNMGMCYIMLCIRKQYDVNVATLISDSIHHFVLQQGGTNPDLRKGLGFPSLITSLCATNGIQINLFARIRTPIDKKIVERSCLNKWPTTIAKTIESRTSNEAMVHLINQLHSPTVPDMSMLDYMKNLESHMKYVQQQQAANHRAMVSLNGSFHSYALHHSGQST